MLTAHRSQDIFNKSVKVSVAEGLKRSGHSQQLQHDLVSCCHDETTFSWFGGIHNYANSMVCEACLKQSSFLFEQLSGLTVLDTNLRWNAHCEWIS